MWLSKSATKAQQVAGWKLETFLTSPTSQEQFSQATGYIPINNKTGDLASQKKFLATSAPTQAFLKQVKNTPVNTVTAGCVSGAMTNIRTANVNQMQAAFAGSKSVDSALSAMTASAKTAIAQYRQQLGQ
jgi:sn-glycerol 3-phosphate transport system substrate-binding protein